MRRRRIGLLPALLIFSACASAELAAPPPPARPALRRLEPGTFLLARTGDGSAPAVLFEHWRHRSRYTCRLCHVDIGFALARGATGVSAETIASGHHCGACHNGRPRARDRVAFAACDEGPVEGDCLRCHAGEGLGSGDGLERHARDYDAFARGLPRTPSGQPDWARAEAERRLSLLDFAEGAAPVGARLKMERDVAFELDRAGGIVFSHARHARWSGCELCHPQIFTTRAKATLGFRMRRIMAGDQCGACHGKVAFDLGECGLCHTEPRDG
ncbi:c(7)-type cytochrome triheme domain-containing protein [Anaeromyxobacter paludicola]|uniref:Cytochrome c7-like domain-containing protein n=1 Tax=Anaeromyxobacter paludicola TaxID=2918171 RepID=A0ABM7XBG1_9BACT|nr:c(7)-type cytochrome triheme domain-containing protein [Anaeromyxobacter paludicola]BDG09212.1 hypothetical protein AMPC_23250 [Anaeromyxobacter paludicola]